MKTFCSRELSLEEKAIKIIVCSYRINVDTNKQKKAKTCDLLHITIRCIKVLNIRKLNRTPVLNIFR